MYMKNYLSLFMFIFAISAESSDLNIKNINPQIDLLVHKTPTCGCCNPSFQLWKTCLLQSKDGIHKTPKIIIYTESKNRPPR